MTIRTIRSTRRYAVCLPVRVATEARRATKGLLIELSKEGARISGLGEAPLGVGQRVSLVLPDRGAIECTVRWSQGGLAGFRLTTPLHSAELESLLDYSETQPHGGHARYGT